MKRTHGEMRANSLESEANNANDSSKTSNSGVKSHQPKISRKIRACEYSTTSLYLFALCCCSPRLLYAKGAYGVTEFPCSYHALPANPLSLNPMSFLTSAQLSDLLVITTHSDGSFRSRMPEPQDKVRHRARRLRLRSVSSAESPLRGE